MHFLGKNLYIFRFFFFKSSSSESIEIQSSHQIAAKHNWSGFWCLPLYSLSFSFSSPLQTQEWYVPVGLCTAGVTFLLIGSQWGQWEKKNMRDILKHRSIQSFPVFKVFPLGLTIYSGRQKIVLLLCSSSLTYHSWAKYIRMRGLVTRFCLVTISAPTLNLYCGYGKILKSSWTQNWGEEMHS